MYVFPGIGLGTILSKATTVTQSMIYASATSLSTSLLPSEVEQGWLYPEISRIRDVSVVVAMGVIRAAQEASVDREQTIRNMGDEELEKWVRSKMYDPLNETERIEHEVQSLVDLSNKEANRGSHL
jgi:malate dehydrogenase (oxaloacetate-decarboxylating)(NADP+)